MQGANWSSVIIHQSWCTWVWHKRCFQNRKLREDKEIKKRRSKTAAWTQKMRRRRRRRRRRRLKARVNSHIHTDTQQGNPRSIQKTICGLKWMCCVCSKTFLFNSCACGAGGAQRGEREEKAGVKRFWLLDRQKKKRHIYVYKYIYIYICLYRYI